MISRPPKPAKTLELAQAEADTLQRLRQGDLRGAAETVAAYEARQPVARGIGIDWTRHKPDGDVVALASIYADQSVSDAIRAAAAMMYLWGVSKPYRRWLGREANGDEAALRLLLRAYGARRADSERKAARIANRRP